MSKINHKETLNPITAPFFKIKLKDSYLASIRRHSVEFEKTKRKNSVKLQGFHELVYALYLILEDYVFVASENPEPHYKNLEIEYCNVYGYYQTILAGELFDLEKLVPVVEKHKDLFLDEQSPYVPSNVFKAILGKKAQSFDFLFVSEGNKNMSKDLTSMGIVHSNCGFFTPPHTLGTHYFLYVMKSEEDMNLAILTVFKKSHKMVDLREIRKDFLDCIKVPKP